MSRGSIAILQQRGSGRFRHRHRRNAFVREFVAAAFARAGIADWERHVDYDRSLTRPAEVDLLCGDASKSRDVLGSSRR